MIKSSLHSNGPRRGTVLASCWPFDVPRCRGCLRLGTGSQGSRNRVGSNATPLSFGVVTKFNQFRCFSQPCRCCVRVLDHPSSNHAYIYLYLSWGRDQKANRHSFSLSFQLPHRFVPQWCDHLNRREHSTPTVRLSAIAVLSVPARLARVGEHAASSFSKFIELYTSFSHYLRLIEAITDFTFPSCVFIGGVDRWPVCHVSVDGEWSTSLSCETCLGLWLVSVPLEFQCWSWLQGQ